MGQIRFHIVNMMRTEPLVAKGMRPVVKTKHLPWERDCESIEFKDTYTEIDQPSLKSFTYSFSYTFKSKGTISFAYCYPYTYSDLSSYLSKISLEFPEYIKIHTLTQTLCQNRCEYTIITDNVSTYSFSTPHPQKKAVIITSRIHPGESNTSFIAEGFIDFLLSSDKDAEILRKHFVFFIVPMLNPDGVRHGNYRCSAIGVDLNRRWISPNKTLHPTIYHTKELISTVSTLHEVILYCDFHGHSKKKNVFMYGVSSIKTIRQTSTAQMIVPVLMAKMNKNFSYEECHYRMEKYKESTARISLHKQFGIRNSYTLECSMYGSDYKPSFDIADLKQIGQDLAISCKSLISIKQSLLTVEIYLRQNKKKQAIKRPALSVVRSSKKVRGKVYSINVPSDLNEERIQMKNNLQLHSKELAPATEKLIQTERRKSKCTPKISELTESPPKHPILPAVNSHFKFKFSVVKSRKTTKMSLPLSISPEKTNLFPTIYSNFK